MSYPSWIKAELRDCMRNRKPAGMPLAVWRLIRRYRVIGALCGYGMLIVGVLLLINGMRLCRIEVFDDEFADYLRWTGVPAMLVLIGVCWAVPRLGARHVFLFLQRNDHAVCIQCGSSVQSVESGGHCPVCQEIYDPAETKRFWDDLVQKSESDSLEA